MSAKDPNKPPFFELVQPDGKPQPPVNKVDVPPTKAEMIMLAEQHQGAPFTREGYEAYERARQARLAQARLARDSSEEDKT